MGKTISEKILHSHNGRKALKPGDYVFAKVDLCMGNDLTSPVAIDEFRRFGQDAVCDPSKIALVPDHFMPGRDCASAKCCSSMREFAREQGIEQFYDVGEMGIAHNLLPEKGLISAGDLVVGADAHTCTLGALGAFAIGVGSTDLAGVMLTGKCWFQVPETIKVVFNGDLLPWVSAKDLGLFLLRQIGFDGAHYQAVEFHGEAVRALSQEGRFTLCNMADAVSAKVGLITPDETTKEFLSKCGAREGEFLNSDKNASFVATVEYDATLIKPQVALPHSSAHVLNIDEVGKEPLDQVYIGSCTNGWLEDMRIAAEVLVLAGRKVHPRTKLIVIPSTPEIYRRAMREGLLQTFADAGAVISSPTCGPCFGGHTGVLGPGERCLSTSSRNAEGRMGSADAEIFLSNPAVAAASAVLGRVASPEEI